MENNNFDVNEFLIILYDKMINEPKSSETRYLFDTIFGIFEDVNYVSIIDNIIDEYIQFEYSFRITLALLIITNSYRDVLKSRFKLFDYAIKMAEIEKMDLIELKEHLKDFR